MKNFLHFLSRFSTSLSVVFTSTECITVFGLCLKLVKFGYDGLVLGSSLFSPLPQLPQKMMLDSKVVIRDSKIIILLCGSKSVTHSVFFIILSGFIERETKIIVF